MSAKPKIFFFGPLPPPTHGMAVVNAQMVQLLGKYADVIIGDTSPGGLVRDFAYHMRKAFRVLRIIGQLPIARAHGTRILYGSPDDGWGGLWTIAIMLMARLLGMQITLHHHSFLYLLRPTKLLHGITALAGPSANHIAIGSKMAEKLQEYYPSVRNVHICENNVSVPGRGIDQPVRSAPAIGILSNLTTEKGALEFLEIFEAVSEKGLMVRALMAGPAPDPEVRKAIDAATLRHPDSLTYIGPVYGDQKEDFFGEIDFFVFPTRYKTESFGLVLLESLVRGVRIISYERGCNGQLRDLPGVTLVDEDDGLLQPVLVQLAHFAGAPIDRATVAQAANARNDANLLRLDWLARQIAGGWA